MQKLIYYIDKGKHIYTPLLEYQLQTIGTDELYARQLCTYFIVDGMQYERMSNELEGENEIIVVKENGRSICGENEYNYRGEGITLELRNPHEHFKLLHTIKCNTHYEVIRYLLKDIIEVPMIGLCIVTSNEIDEDRGAYVIYVTEMTSNVQ